jgi:uncharacterized protein YqjF (DUF2071 family)
MHRSADPADGPADLARSWVWSQEWRDLLFLHWQVPAAALRPWLPGPVEVAAYAGAAWVSVVLFRLRVRPWCLPFVPGFSELVEVNLRTYVRWRGRPGIWFLSVHANNPWAIRAARLLTPLPYAHAPLCYRALGGRFELRTEPGPGPGPGLALAYAPFGIGTAAEPGSLDEWLLERYRLFVPGRRGTLLQAEVLHPPWLTQDAEASADVAGLGVPFGLDLGRRPDRVHYSAGLRARFGVFRGARDARTGRARVPC